MQRKERESLPFNKSGYYTDLAQKFSRSAKAFEFRMQNISYVLSLMGRDWLNGLRPAKNVGIKVAAQIEALVLELSQIPHSSVVAFEMEARESFQNQNLQKPIGSKKPEITISQVVQYKRDPQVKAWVIKEADGVCECCGNDAPFETVDGLPFLEVHHIRRLADGGSDTTSNAVAICPNCHRDLHYGIKSKEPMGVLLKIVPRLIKE